MKMATHGSAQSWSPSELDERLWLAVKRETASRSFTIASGCEGYLRSFINVGVGNLLNKDLQSDALQIDLAEAILIAFVIKMMVEARSTGSFTLHEGTFARAQSFFCPCWPFC